MKLAHFSLALKQVRKRKLRSWLTLCGITISIATIFLLIALSLGLQGAVAEQFRQLGTDKFFIQPRDQFTGPGTGSTALLTEKDVELIEGVLGVKEVTYFVASAAKVEFHGEVRFVQAIGFPLEHARLFYEDTNYRATEGRELREGDRGKVNLGSQFAFNAIFQKPVHARDTILIQERRFEVLGIMNPRGNPGDDRLVLFSIEDFRTLFTIPERIDNILVQVDSSKDIKEVAARVEKELQQFRGLRRDALDFSVLTPEEVLGSFTTVFTIITVFLASVAAISLLVGGIGIANTMYTSVLERTKEIGTMKAVGAKNSDILFIFLIESGLFGFFGGAIGVGVGSIVAYVVEFIAFKKLGTTLFQTETPLSLVGACLLFACIVGVASGMWPAYRASTLKTVDALRYE